MRIEEAQKQDAAQANGKVEPARTIGSRGKPRALSRKVKVSHRRIACFPTFVYFPVSGDKSLDKNFAGASKSWVSGAGCNGQNPLGSSPSMNASRMTFGQ